MQSFEVQRKNMVDNQIRPSDITDRRILRAMLDIPREAFVPEELQSFSYSDQELRITSPNQPGHARYLAPPDLLAKMIQALELGDDDTVLHIAGGTGYGSAVLSKIAKKVVALEDDKALSDRARHALSASGIGNVDVVTGDLTQGDDERAPYDGILIEGSVAEIPMRLLDQLKDGGRLVVVRSNGTVGEATRWYRDGGHFGEQPLFDATLPALASFARSPQFVF